MSTKKSCSIVVRRDVVELKPEEKGVRTQYDQDNPALFSRRNLISKQTATIVENNAVAEVKAKEIKVNDVGVKDAQGELVKLISTEI